MSTALRIPRIRLAHRACLLANTPLLDRVGVGLAFVVVALTAFVVGGTL